MGERHFDERTDSPQCAREHQSLNVDLNPCTVALEPRRFGKTVTAAWLTRSPRTPMNTF